MPKGIAKNDRLELAGTEGCTAGVQKESTIFSNIRILFWARNTLDKIPFSQGSCHSGVFICGHSPSLRSNKLVVSLRQTLTSPYATEGLAGAKVMTGPS